MNVVIDRSKWIRGNKDGLLIRAEDEHKCCLGFLGVACGVPHEEMVDQGLPQEIESAMWPSWVTRPVRGDGDDRYLDTSWTAEAVSINDNVELTEYQREEFLTDHFAAKGVTLVFVDAEIGSDR